MITMSVLNDFDVIHVPADKEEWLRVNRVGWTRAVSHNGSRRRRKAASLTPSGDLQTLHLDSLLEEAA